MNSDILDSTRAIALEFCDESDIRYYEKIQEYHVVIKQTDRETITESLKRLGWNIHWSKENIREGWDRLAFIQS